MRYCCGHPRKSLHFPEIRSDAAGSSAGNIPEELGTLTRLEVLWVGFNRLTGEAGVERGRKPCPTVDRIAYPSQASTIVHVPCLCTEGFLETSSGRKLKFVLSLDTCRCYPREAGEPYSVEAAMAQQQRPGRLVNVAHRNFLKRH